MYPNLAPPHIPDGARGAAHGRSADFWEIPAGRPGTPIRGSFPILIAFRLLFFIVGSSMGALRGGWSEIQHRIHRHTPESTPSRRGPSAAFWEIATGRNVTPNRSSSPSLIASRLLVFRVGLTMAALRGGWSEIQRLIHHHTPESTPSARGPAPNSSIYTRLVDKQKTGRLYSCDQTRRRLEPYIHARPDTIPRKKARAL